MSPKPVNGAHVEEVRHLAASARATLVTAAPMVAPVETPKAPTVAGAQTYEVAQSTMVSTEASGKAQEVAQSTTAVH